MSVLTEAGIICLQSAAKVKGTEYCVFDIETVPINFNSQPPNIQNYITEKISKTCIGTWTNEDISKFCSLNPLFGKVSAICIKGPNYHLGFYGVDEHRIISDFWHAIQILFPNRMVSYNGKGFDTPFIITRSAINNINPTYKISTHKYDTWGHFDVMDALSGFNYKNNVPMDIATQIMCGNAPKETAGNLMEQLYLQNDFEAIAQHCMRDVAETESLFLKLKPFYDKKNVRIEQI